MRTDPFQVYVLMDPRNMVPRYAVVSVHPRIRLRQHIGESLRGGETRKNRWIRKLVREGVQPTIRVLDESAVNAKDEVLWINRLRSCGFPLINLSNGGDGNWGYIHTKKDLDRMKKIPEGEPFFIDKSGCRRRFVMRVCSQCDKPFPASVTEVARGNGYFCCKLHQLDYYRAYRERAIKPGEEWVQVGRSRYRLIQQPCKKCGKPFKIRAARVNEGKGLYCSRSCSARDRKMPTNAEISEDGKKLQTAGMPGQEV